MSVYKSRRKDAAAEFVSAARELRKVTVRIIKKFPTSYRWEVTNNMLELAGEVYTATQDKIWLLGEFEVFGARTGANSAEQNYQKQYDYYKNGNSKIKYKHSDTGSACSWWLRSVYAGNASNFRYVYTSGGSINYYAYYSLGFAPGFKRKNGARTSNKKVKPRPKT